MSDCIRITSLEHLIQEQTLLINYNITCTGVWDLSQMHTAYRGVCDEDWVVMFPNIQHPRHTDLPIAVDVGGASCSFAWNYGSIRGISPENFDAAHSYLVQLCIYDHGCDLTGVVVGPGMTGVPPVNPYNPRPPNPYRQPPAHPIPPPGSNGGGGTTNPNVPAPGVPAPPSPPPPPPPPDSAPPAGPPPGGPSGGQQTDEDGAGSTIEPEDPHETRAPEVIVSSPNDTQGTRGGEEEDPSIRGGDGTRNEGDIRINAGLYSSINAYLDRAGGTYTPGGGPVGPYNGSVSTNVTSAGSNTIGTFPGTVTDPPTWTTTSPVGTQTNTSDPGGNSGGIVIGGTTQTHNPPGPIIQVDRRPSPLSRVDPSTVQQGSRTILEISSSEVERGTTVIISAVFIPSLGTELLSNLILYLLDPSRSVIPLRTEENVTVNDGNPGRLNFRLNTSQLNSNGRYTVTFLVRDTLGRAQGIASRLLRVNPSALVRTKLPPASSTEPPGQTIQRIKQPPALPIEPSVTPSQRIKQPPAVSIGQEDSVTTIGRSDLSQRLNQLGEIGTRVGINYTNNTPVYILLTKKPNTTNRVSIIVSDDYHSQSEPLTIGIHSSVSSTSFGITPAGTIVQTSERVRLDNAVLEPNTHQVGVVNQATTASTIVVSLVPGQTSPSASIKTARLYISEQYEMATPTVTATRSSVISNSNTAGPVTIVGTFPYAFQELGLIVHGRDPGYIPENYTIYNATTNGVGQATWTSISMKDNDCYSIILPAGQIYDPFKGALITSRIIK